MADPLDDIVHQMAQEKANVSLYGSQATDPGAAARANQLGRQTGVSADIIQSDPRAWEAQQRINEGRQLAETTPQAAGWLGDPRNAAAVGHDYPGLQKVASVLAPQPAPASPNVLTSPAQDYANRDRSFFGILMASTANAGLRSWGNLVGTAGHIMDYVPGLHGAAMDYEEKARRIAANTSFAIKGRSDYNYHYSDIWHDPLKYLRNAPRETVMQIAESIPMLAETFAGKGVPLATDITAQIANARAKNNGRAEATDRDYVAALPAGIVSAAMFRSAKGEDLHGLLNIASSPKSMLAELGEAAIRDPITMGSQSAIQNIAETVGTKRGFQYGEMRDQAADSAIQGSTASLAMIGLGGIAARPFRAMRDATMAREGAVQIDNLMDAAAKAKSRTSAPDEFQSFVDAHTQGTSNEHVYIPGEAISTLFQSDTGAPRNIATDPFWSKYAPAVDEATRIGGDVVVPVSELATHLAGSSDWNALRDHVRFNPGGMSLAEASEYAKRAPEDMEAAAATLAAQMDQGAGHLAATRKSYQLFRDAGLPHGEAATAGALQAAWIRRVNEIENGKRVARGEDPISAAEEWDRHNLTAQKMRQEAYEAGQAGKAARAAPKAAGGAPAPDMGTFDPHPHLAAFTSYVADRKNSLDREAIAKQFGIQPEDADKLLGLAASTPASPIFITRGKPAKYRTVQTGGGKKAGTKQVLVSEATPSTIRRVPQRNGPVDVIDFLKDRGGVRDDATAGHALAQGRNWLKRFPGLISKKGMSIDDAAQALHEAGYFDGHDRPTVDDALQLIENGRGRYRSADTAEIENRRQSALQDEHVQKATAEIERALADNPLLKGVAEKMEPDDRQAVLERMASGESADEAIYGHMEEKSRDVLRDASNDSAAPDFDVPFDQKGGPDAALGDLLATRGQAGTGSDGQAGSPRDAQAGSRAGADLSRPGGSSEGDGSLGLDAEQRGLTPQEQRHLAEMRARLQQSKISRTGQQGVGDQAGGLFDVGRDQGALFQGDKRGNISIARGADTMPYAATIRAFESANVSTAVHEMGHYWIEDLRARALRDDATPQEKADWQAVKDWFFDLGHSVDEKEMIPEAAHENWARGVERYVMEGKAPSSALKGVFARMATWLRGIYKSVLAPDAPITPEIRDVMNRLLATDEEIAIARDNLSAKPMEGAEALMTESEREAYHKLASETQDDAYQSLLERTMQVIRARTTSDYRERRDAIREEVIQSVDAKPVHRAMKTFREGVNGEKVKIPEQWLKDTYGPDIKDRLPKSVDPIWGKEGIDPEEIAGRAGFDSADQMVKALMEMAAAKEAMKASGDKRSVRAAAIEEQLKARVDAEIGDPYRDVETEAKAAIANDKMGDLFSMETRALARVTGRAPTVWKQATEWAKGHIAGQTTQDALTGASLQRYARSVAKAGKQAEDALAHDDHDAALTFKKQQLLNAALLSEAKKAKERVEIAARKLQRIARAKNIKAVDQDYLEQAHALLEQVRMDTESGVKIGKIKSFQKWYDEQLDNGREPIVPDDYKELLGTQNWREMRVEDLLELNDFVGQIIAMGRLKKTLRDGVRVRDRETAIQEMLDRAEANVVQRKQSARYDEKSGFLAGMPARFKGVIRSADAAMLKFEQLMNFMDNAEANGPWTRMMMSPINKAAADASRLMRPLLETIQQAIKDTPREVLDTWSRPVDTPELLNWVQTDQPHLLGQPWQFNKDSIISMALNWGNEGNKQRLLDGYHWHEADVKAVMDRVLSEHDWRYVDTVLKQVGSLWPAIEELERRVNGYAPDKIEATPIETPFGTLEGGYFPAVYDPDLASAADLVKMEKLSGGGFHSVSTRASATKERMDRVEKPILLDTTVVTRHLREVIHDVSHREAVFQVRSLLGEDRVKAAITNLMGPEYYQAAKGWIENVAHPGIADSLQDKRLIAFVKGLNKRITVAGLGFRISTILQQPTNFATTMAEVGNARYAKHMAMFHVDLAKGTPAMWKEVMTHSEEMRERMHNLDTNISDFYAQQAKNPLITGPGKIMNAAFKGIALTDLYITVPGWMAAYEKATVENEMTHEEAVNYADGIIRKTQGAGGPKDQAAIQRTVWMKAFNPFFSYWSSHYNMQRSIGHEARRVKNPAHITNLVNRMVLQLLVPMAVQQALFGPKKGKDSDGKEESEVHYLLNGVLLGNMMSIPGLSPVLNHFGYGYPYKPSPWARFEEAGEKTYKDVVKGYKHEEGEGDEPKSWIRDTFDTIAYTGALPVSQAGATLQGLYDYHRGEAHPDGFNDWSDLLTKGKVEKHNQ